MPPRSARNMPVSALRGTPARFRAMPPRCCAAAFSRGNTDRIDSCSTSPAWMPPSSGSAIRSTVCGPNRRRKNDATDSSVSRRRGNERLQRQRAARRPVEQVVSPAAPRASSECRAPTATAGDAAALRAGRKRVRGGRVGISRAGEAELLAELQCAAGFCTSSESGPASIVKPSTCSVRISPPSAATPRAARNSTRAARVRIAAASPVMPPPTMTITAAGIRRSRVTAAQRDGAAERPALALNLRARRFPTWPPADDAMHVPRELLHALERRLRQHAVAEIEDVAGPPARASQDVVRGGEQAIAGPSSSVGSRLPCTARSCADDLPRFVERQPPVDADHVAARLGQIGQNRRRSRRRNE